MYHTPRPVSLLFCLRIFPNIGTGAAGLCGFFQCLEKRPGLVAVRGFIGLGQRDDRLTFAGSLNL